MAAFPLRVVYMKNEERKVAGDEQRTVDEEQGMKDTTQRPPVSILVSVPKKRFRHAVDRNRMKRLVREAYRLNKKMLWDALADKDYSLVMAFVCITDQLPSFYAVNKSMKKAITRIAESLNKP